MTEYVIREIEGFDNVAATWSALNDAFEPPFFERYKDPKSYLTKIANNGRTVACFVEERISACASFYAND